MFVNDQTKSPIFLHRKGSNAKYGYYYADKCDTGLLGHYKGKCNVPIELLKKEYNRISQLTEEELERESKFVYTFNTDKNNPAQFEHNENRALENSIIDAKKIKDIVSSADDQGRWLVKHVMISHPYIGDGALQDLTYKYSSTLVGDSTDTSPYIDLTDQLYISTDVYIKNMKMLIHYLNSVKR